jgi:hypothetical protein
MVKLGRVSQSGFYRFDDADPGPDPDMDLRDAIHNGVAPPSRHTSPGGTHSPAWQICSVSGRDDYERDLSYSAQLTDGGQPRESRRIWRSVACMKRHQR